MYPHVRYCVQSKIHLKKYLAYLIDESVEYMRFLILHAQTLKFET